MMNRRRANMQAYLAGIIDGEGCIGIFEANGTWQARVTVQMDNPDAVLLLWRYYPQGRVAYRNEAWSVTYSHLRAYELLKDIREFLIVKHRQAKIALSFLVHRRRQHRQPHAGGCTRCATLARLLRDIRHEDKRVKTVDAHLDHEMRQYRAKPGEVAEDVRAMNAQMSTLLDGVETRDWAATPFEPTSAREQEIVHEGA